jgi:hypothetical protein
LAYSAKADAETFLSNSVEFSYRGAWTNDNQLFKDRPALLSSTPGAEVSFDFEGNQLRIFRAYNPNQGRVGICIDTTCKVVNNKSFYRLPDPQPWGKTFPAIGKHHVSIQVESGSFCLCRRRSPFERRLNSTREV